MSAMYKELQELSREELMSRLHDAKRQYYQTREEILTAKEQNHAQLRYLRRQIARIQTRLQEL